MTHYNFYLIYIISDPAQALPMPRETYLPTGMRGLITCPFLANPPLLHVDWTKDGAPLDVTLVSPRTRTELDQKKTRTHSQKPASFPTHKFGASKFSRFFVRIVQKEQPLLNDSKITILSPP